MRDSDHTTIYPPDLSLGHQEGCTHPHCTPTCINKYACALPHSPRTQRRWPGTSSATPSYEPPPGLSSLNPLMQVGIQTLPCTAGEKLRPLPQPLGHDLLFTNPLRGASSLVQRQHPAHEQVEGRSTEATQLPSQALTLTGPPWIPDPSSLILLLQ